MQYMYFFCPLQHQFIMIEFRRNWLLSFLGNPVVLSCNKLILVFFILITFGRLFYHNIFIFISHPKNKTLIKKKRGRGRGREKILDQFLLNFLPSNCIFVYWLSSFSFLVFSIACFLFQSSSSCCFCQDSLSLLIFQIISYFRCTYFFIFLSLLKIDTGICKDSSVYCL